MEHCKVTVAISVPWLLLSIMFPPSSSNLCPLLSSAHVHDSPHIHSLIGFVSLFCAWCQITNHLLLIEMTSSSRSGSRLKGQNAQPAVKRSGITRVRTGCTVFSYWFYRRQKLLMHFQTCRRRKKKCDESKPYCLNCTKANVQCPGRCG